MTDNISGLKPTSLLNKKIITIIVAVLILILLFSALELLDLISQLKV